MRLSQPRSIFLPLVLPALSSALQVTPNSPCSTQCMDDMNDNVSDPDSSNTLPKDIVCNNADYNTTTAGQKFKSCVNCLQTSSFSSSKESDQAWFLYNLRYAVDWCLYGYPSNGTTIGGPCLTSQACGSLSTALESGILNPSNGSTYDYCSAGGGVFTHDTINQCTSCLIGQSDKSYLSNFLIALQAACEQETAVGVVIGLNDTIFSSTQVAITTISAAAAATATSNSSGSSGLSVGAKIGIIIGSLVALLILAGFAFIWWKKRERRLILQSKYDPRFGAPEISAPIAHDGTYATAPYHSSPAKTKIFVKYNPKEFKNADELPGKPTSHSPAGTEFSTGSNSQPSSPFSTVAIPVHQAYIPTTKAGLSSLEPLTPPTFAFSSHNRSPSKSSPQSASAHSYSTKSSPTVVAPYNYDPSRYTPSEKEPVYRAPNGHLRAQPTRQQAWTVDSTQSVELWPGSM